MSARREPAGAVAPASSRRDIRALTGLRAVAATLVVLLHFQRITGPYLDQLPVLRAIVNAGWLGVDLFFVLSGFVLALSYLDDLGHAPRPAAIGRFLVNRLARVWPAWAVVTVVMAGWLWVWRTAGYNADFYAPHPWVHVDVLLRNLSMTQMWGRESFSGASFLVPGWSISAEWLAYLAFPLLALLLRPLLRAPAAAVVVLACAAMAPLAVSAFRHGHLDVEQSWLARIACGFVAGMLAAIAARRVERTPRVESLAFTASVVLTLWLVAVFLWNGWRRAGDLDHDYGGAAVVLFPLLVLALTLTDRGPAKLLSSRILVQGGKISYCLYLTHFVVLDVFVSVMWRDPADLWEFDPGFTLALPALLVAPFVLAAALHRWVEEPARRRVLALADALALRRAARGASRRPPGVVAPARAAAPAVAGAAAEPAAARPQPAGDSGAVPGRHAAARPVTPRRTVGGTARSRVTTVGTGT